MRLTKSRLKTYQLYKHKTTVTKEGARVQGYHKTPTTIQAIIWSAGGRVQASMYGDRLAYMLNLLCYHTVDIKEKDGIAVYSQEKADYRVISIKRWQNHLQVELEAIRGV